MAKFGKWFTNNWIWIAIGCVLTKLAIDYAYIERGYKAYGGEWLILPVVLFVVSSVKHLMQEERKFRKEEENEIRAERNCRELQKRRSVSQRQRGGGH